MVLKLVFALVQIVGYSGRPSLGFRPQTIHLQSRGHCHCSLYSSGSENHVRLEIVTLSRLQQKCLPTNRTGDSFVPRTVFGLFCPAMNVQTPCHCCLENVSGEDEPNLTTHTHTHTQAHGNLGCPHEGCLEENR